MNRRKPSLCLARPEAAQKYSTRVQNSTVQRMFKTYLLWQNILPIHSWLWRDALLDRVNKNGMMKSFCLTDRSTFPSYGVIRRCQECEDDSNGSYHRAWIFRNDAQKEEMVKFCLFFRNWRLRGESSSLEERLYSFLFQPTFSVYLILHFCEVNQSEFRQWMRVAPEFEQTRRVLRRTQ